MCDKPPGFVVVDAVVTVDSVEVSVVDSLVNDSDPEEGEESVMNGSKPVVMFAKVMGRTVELCDIFAEVVGGAVELYNMFAKVVGRTVCMCMADVGTPEY